MGSTEANLGQVSTFPIMTLPASPAKNIPEKRTWKLSPTLRFLGWIGQFAPVPVGRLALHFFLRPRRKERPFADQAILRSADECPRIPFTSSFRKNTKLQCYIWGQGKRTIVLVHGWESQAGRLGPFVAPLVEAGFRVISFDGPAHGDSPGVATDMPDFAQAIQTVVESFGGAYAVIGHSFGAAATLWLLAQKQHPALERLVLLGAPSGARSMLQIFADRLELHDNLRKGLEDAVAKHYGQSLNYFDLPKRIPAITTKTLLIHDRHDNLVPYSEGESLVAALPDATLYTTEGLWHSSTIKDANVISHAVKFLSS